MNYPIIVRLDRLQSCHQLATGYLYNKVMAEFCSFPKCRKFKVVDGLVAVLMSST
jgi:hypothetical protein